MSAAGGPLSARRPPRAARLSPLVTAAAVTLALLGLGLAQTAPGRSLLGELNLAKPREPFTELYFAQPRALAGVTQGTVRSRVAVVSFVINDLEHRTMTYDWALAVGARTRARGAVSLRSGKSAVITRTLYRMCPKPAGRAGAHPVNIRVTLSHPTQSISYWEACRG